MGQPFKTVWPEIWHDIWPLIERALAGQATWMENMHLVMERNGAPENTWYTFSYSPAFDDTGAIGGMICSCIETTAQVVVRRLADYRLSLDRELRTVSDSNEAMYRASTLLDQKLGLARVGYGDVDTSGLFVVVELDWTDGTVGTVAGTHRMAAFGHEIVAGLRVQQTVMIDDVDLEKQAGIEMLVTDVGLPNGMNGRQLADAIRTKAPTLPVLFIPAMPKRRSSARVILMNGRGFSLSRSPSNRWKTPWVTC